MNPPVIFRRLPLTDTPNARDLGGYATRDGGITRWNVFLRSACPNKLTESDVELLKRIGVTAVVDLRGGGNEDELLTGYTQARAFRCYNFPVGGGNPPAKITECGRSYLEIADNPNMYRVFAALADNQGATVFHCFAGKDRTGIVASILLMLAGVADVDIIADYTQSYAYFLERIRADFDRTDAERDVFIPHPEHIESFMRLFRAKYGDAQNYLLRMGLTQTQINCIIGKFVEFNQ